MVPTPLISLKDSPNSVSVSSFIRLHLAPTVFRLLKPYVANIDINLWGRDLLQQWNTQINIPLNIEVSHRLANDSGRNIKRYYEKQSQTIQVMRNKAKQLLMFQ